MLKLLASLHPVAVLFIVCFAKIVEISIQSLKTCMMEKVSKYAGGYGMMK